MEQVPDLVEEDCQFLELEVDEEELYNGPPQLFRDLKPPSGMVVMFQGLLLYSFLWILWCLSLCWSRITRIGRS